MIKDKYLPAIHRVIARQLEFLGVPRSERRDITEAFLQSIAERGYLGKTMYYLIQEDLPPFVRKHRDLDIPSYLGCP